MQPDEVKSNTGDVTMFKLVTTASATEMSSGAKQFNPHERSSSVQPTSQSPLLSLKNKFMEKAQLHRQMQEALVNLEKTLGRNQFVYADLSQNETEGLMAIPVPILKSHIKRKRPPTPGSHQSDESPRLKPVKRDPLVNYNQQYVDQETQSMNQYNNSQQVVVRLIKEGLRDRLKESEIQEHSSVQLPVTSRTVYDRNKRPQCKDKVHHARALSQEEPSNDMTGRLNLLLKRSIAPVKDSGISAMQRRRLRMKDFLADRREIEEWIARDNREHALSQPRQPAKDLSNLEKYGMDFGEYLFNQSSYKMKQYIQRQRENRQRNTALDRYQQDALQGTHFSERIRRRLQKEFATVRQQLRRFE